MQAVKLWLEPHEDIHRFQTLHWGLTEVGMEEVLLTGVHPWLGPDKPSTLSSAFLQRINEKSAKVPNLMEHGLCGDVVALPHIYPGMGSTLANVLDNTGRNLYFVDDLDYLELREIGIAQLKKGWNCVLAGRMAQAAHPTFQELRRFLKTKDKSLKLKSYEDFHGCELQVLVSVDDFLDRDPLLVAEGLPVRNFRRAAWLTENTDGEGRLRLVPEIRHLTLKTTSTSADFKCSCQSLTWHVTRRDRTLTFRPDIRADVGARVAAEEFAVRWRTNEGRLCFETSLERLVEIVESGVAAAEFPSLNYRQSGEQQPPVARAELQGSSIVVYVVGSFVHQGQPARVLRSLLRNCGACTSGRKEDLLKRLAVLATEHYREHLAQLDGYFDHCRFIRVDALPDRAVGFPVLKQNPPLKNLVLALYVLKHLRGNAILDASHENDTYTVEDLALALVTGRVALSGAFLPVG